MEAKPRVPTRCHINREKQEYERCTSDETSDEMNSVNQESNSSIAMVTFENSCRNTADIDSLMSAVWQAQTHTDLRHFYRRLISARSYFEPETEPEPCNVPPSFIRREIYSAFQFLFIAVRLFPLFRHHQTLSAASPYESKPANQFSISSSPNFKMFHVFHTLLCNSTFKSTNAVYPPAYTLFCILHCFPTFPAIYTRFNFNLLVHTYYSFFRDCLL